MSLGCAADVYDPDEAAAIEQHQGLAPALPYGYEAVELGSAAAASIAAAAAAAPIVVVGVLVVGSVAFIVYANEALIDHAGTAAVLERIAAANRGRWADQEDVGERDNATPVPYPNERRSRCQEWRRRELQNAVDDLCAQPMRCTNIMACTELDWLKSNAQRCVDARNRVLNECYPDSYDQGHIDEMLNRLDRVLTCQSLINDAGCNQQMRAIPAPTPPRASSTPSP